MTSHSEPPEDASREELVPALNPEVQERDPGLIALVRSLVSLELRLAELPPPRLALGEAGEDEERIKTDLKELELQLRRYTEELAVNRKVDRYTSMLAYLEQQRDTLAAEIRRLTTRKRAAQAIIDRMLSAAHYALSLLPKPLYGGVRELEGTQSSLALVRNPGRVNVIDRTRVPPEWRQATVKLNLRLWHEVLDALPFEFAARVTRLCSLTDEVILSALAPVLKTGVHVDGVEWVQDHRVQRR
jgi:hypothetical protein